MANRIQLKSKGGEDPDAHKDHKFWGKQPVPQFTEPKDKEEEKEDGNIEGDKTIEDVQKDPYPLPDAFEWFTPDVNDPEMLEKVYSLLANNYVEDDDAMFRFNYSKEFLLWALTPPGWHSEWHVGIRVKKTGLIIGFISGVPANICVRGKEIPMTEINFLCVHKKTRDRRIAPVLIKEVTRKVNLKGVWQAVYTAGIVLPRPIVTCRYWHRSLNPPKLTNIGFSRVPPQFDKFSRPMEAVKRHFGLPDKPVIPGNRKMEEKDVAAVAKLLNAYLQKFHLHPVLSEEDVRHWLLPRDDVINSFVVEKDGEVTDFLSFYTLPSTIIGNKKYNQLKAAYAYYSVPNTVTLKELIHDSLILAKQLDFDVFNALDIMENEAIFKELKFGIGDGNLQYYLYNWRTPDIKSGDVGLVML
eukprot:TRINITY_DN54955_c0_g1_i2.p1 TRINITY_DN54955_c0_g1~~TRINITY_DN54955_c0_g1_i2.p1  ORF type:complete len:412 (+),score=55.38 TRINITY_DN54955_c0_g1_i2:22-1257(+)